MKKIRITAARAAKCAEITKELSTIVHEGLASKLDAEVAEAHEQGGQVYTVPNSVADHPDIDEALDNVSLDTHKIPSCVLLISYIIKTHTKPSELESLVEGVMLTLGINGKMIGSQSIVDDIAEKFDL